MDSRLIVTLLFLVALVAYFVWSDRASIRSWRIRRQHRRMPPTPIAALADHQVRRIVGHVAGSEQPLTAPLTGRPCVLYQLVIYADAGRRGWTVRTTDRSRAPFAVSDHGATAIVDPSYSRIAVDFDHHEECNAADGPTVEQTAVLMTHGLPIKGWFLYRKYRFEESVIAIGDPIGVIGASVHAPELRIAGTARAPLAILGGPQP
jgi:hypothetical protein